MLLSINTEYRWQESLEIAEAGLGPRLNLQAQATGRDRARAGSHVLTLLAAPMNVAVLRELSETPTPLVQLRKAVGSPPQTTMRKHLAALSEAGIVSRARDNGFPGSASYLLERPGADLAAVARVVQGWLAEAPGGPVELGTVAARSAIKALVEGWSTTLLRALAARPLTLTELDALIADVSYPSLERRLVAMRMAGQVEAVAGSRRGTPYGVTSWLRRATAVIVCAICWERRHLAEATPPIGRLDIESAFLLAAPLLDLDPALSGVCRLSVDVVSRGERHPVGVMVGVERGRVRRCGTRLEGEATASASGSFAAWYRAVRERRLDRLEAGGDRTLAAAVLDGLHAKLARAPA
jgi:DNA-binding HxlR family transcriptional regulator